MSFLETPRCPNDVSRGSNFGPGFSSNIVRTFSGFESANQNWALPLYQGEIVRSVRTEAQLNTFLELFFAAGGMVNAFRFEYKRDYTVSGAEGTLTVITADTTWQMYKTYASSRTKKIVKPLAGAVIAGGGSYSYSTVTGIVTKTAGANPTGWTGSFDYPVRFNTDKMLPEWVNSQLFAAMTIPIVEIRL